MKAKQRIKLFVILGIEFIALAVMLLLIFFAGKQVYTVTFDLNGGVLLSGDLVQKVTQGHNATPPTTAKEGHYFLKWSGSYNRVTHDVTIEAIWEYETTAGIEYNVIENGNYCTIVDAFDGLQGDVYVGAYKDGKKVLGIEDGAFAGCTGITRIHLLEGILTIGTGVFEGCASLQSIELPETAVSLGDNAFKGCESLETVVLPAKLKTLGASVFEGCTSLKEVTVFDDLKRIEANAFLGCSALETITIPEGVEYIGAGAFVGCENLKEIVIPVTVKEIESGVFDNPDLTIYVYTEVEGQNYVPDAWAGDWNGSAKVEFIYPEEELPEMDATEEDIEDKKGKKK